MKLCFKAALKDELTQTNTSLVNLKLIVPLHNFVEFAASFGRLIFMPKMNKMAFLAYMQLLVRMSCNL